LTRPAAFSKTGAELVATTNVTMKVADGLQPWHVVKFKP
jgi:hypothetical protein